MEPNGYIFSKGNRYVHYFTDEHGCGVAYVEGLEEATPFTFAEATAFETEFPGLNKSPILICTNGPTQTFIVEDIDSVERNQ